ncbi:DNA gyrase inhibitor YacG [Terasakiella pusilla]|uniref:DNA gyrase inhibitor YacG n=1 Tax=Terasakiella pusilla TaxID=64973 RepID=UPI003AA885BE
MTDKNNVETLGLTKGGSCPTCQNPSTPHYRPFCSKRCADLDLGTWLNEGYRIESEEESDLDEYEPG